MKYTGCPETMHTSCPEDIDNASTKCVVYIKRQTQYDLFETKNLKKSVFGCYVTYNFVMGLLLVILAKNDGKLCIHLTNYHEKMPFLVI